MQQQAEDGSLHKVEELSESYENMNSARNSHSVYNSVSASSKKQKAQVQLLSVTTKSGHSPKKGSLSPSKSSPTKVISPTRVSLKKIIPNKESPTKNSQGKTSPMKGNMGIAKKTSPSKKHAKK